MATPSPLDALVQYTGEELIPRLAMSLDGLDKRGKTHYAIMTTPTPVIVLTTDTGTDVVVKKARALGKKVGTVALDFPVPDMAIMSAKDVDLKIHAEWKAEWAKVMALKKALLSEPIGPNRTRTLVVDTASMLNKLLELAYFGKARGNARQDLRTEMNGAWHKWFWDLYNNRPDLNILLIHQEKKQYTERVNKDGKTESVWNGKYERDGNTKTGFYVDLSLHFDWDSTHKDFYTEILKEQPFRYLDLERESLMGKRWYAKADPQNPSTFSNLALEVFPQTEMTPEIWGL